MPSPKVPPTPKTNKEKKATLDKGEKTSKTDKKLVSNESANLSSYADVQKVSLLSFVISISIFFGKY